MSSEFPEVRARDLKTPSIHHRGDAVHVPTKRYIQTRSQSWLRLLSDRFSRLVSRAIAERFNSTAGLPPIYHYYQMTEQSSKMDIEKQSPPEQQHQTIQGPTIAQQEDAETQYPPLRQVLPIMLALYLAIFLVALVNHPLLPLLDKFG